MKFIKQSLVLCLAAAVLQPGIASAAANPDAAATSPAKPSPKVSDLFADLVVAKGKGVEVNRKQLDDAMISVRANASAQGRQVTPDEIAKNEPLVLDRLIQMQLLLSRATDADKAKGIQDSDRTFEQIKTNAPSEEMLSRQLKSLGLTLDDLHKKLNEEATAQAVLERELKINISDDEVKKFYTDNPSQFEQPEMVRVSHILFMTRDPQTNQELSSDQKAAKRKTAEEVLKRARNGEDFGKLVTAYSEDPGSKDKGGEYTFPRASADPRRAMVPEFEGAAFSLKTNEISDIVTTQYGYHIIKSLEKIPAKTVELSKVAPKIKEYLAQQEVRKKAGDYFVKLKKDANVEILDPKLKVEEPPAIIAPKTPGTATK
jgi:peptidyl-prolyl cis-trans isomerase C